MKINRHELPQTLLDAIDRFARARDKHPNDFRWPGGGFCMRSAKQLAKGLDRKVQLFLYAVAEIEGESIATDMFCIYPNSPDPKSLLIVGDFGVDSPVCLAYDRSPIEPRVLWFDDSSVWRELAPDFTGFLALFDLGNF